MKDRDTSVEEDEPLVKVEPEARDVTRDHIPRPRDIIPRQYHVLETQFSHRDEMKIVRTKNCDVSPPMSPHIINSSHGNHGNHNNQSNHSNNGNHGDNVNQGMVRNNNDLCDQNDQFPVFTTLVNS